MKNISDYILIGLGAVVAFLGAYNSYLEKKEDNVSEVKSDKRNQRSLVIIIIGILLSLFGGVLSTIKQTTAEAEAIVNKRKSDSLTSALLKKQDELNSNQAQINKLEQIQIDTLRNILKESFTTNELQRKAINAQDQLISSNKKIEALNEEINKIVIGGDSIPILSLFFQPYISPLTLDVDKDFVLVSFQVINKGKYPIRSLKVNIKDFQNEILAITNNDSMISPIKKDSQGLLMGIANSSGFKATIRVDSNFTYDNMNKFMNIGDLPTSAGYLDIYKGKILIDLGHFSYDINMTWNNGNLNYSIYGIVENKTKRIEVVNVTPFVSWNINPFKYIELYPQFVGGELLKFPNPTK